DPSDRYTELNNGVRALVAHTTTFARSSSSVTRGSAAQTTLVRAGNRSTACCGWRTTNTVSATSIEPSAWSASAWPTACGPAPNTTTLTGWVNRENSGEIAAID